MGREAVILAKHCCVRREKQRERISRMHVWRSVILVEERQKVKFFQLLLLLGVQEGTLPGLRAGA